MLVLGSVHATPQSVSHLPQLSLVADGSPVAGLLTFCAGRCPSLSRCRHCIPFLTVSCEGANKNQQTKLIHRQAVAHPGELIDEEPDASETGTAGTTVLLTTIQSQGNQGSLFGCF